MEPMHKIPKSMVHRYNIKPKLDYCDVVLCHWRKDEDYFQIKIYHPVIRKIRQVHRNQDTCPAQAYNTMKTMISDIEHVEQQENKKINRQKEEYNKALETFFVAEPLLRKPLANERGKNRQLQIKVAWSS